MNVPLSKSKVSPAQLAHIAFRTNRLKEMVSWYRTVLAARSNFATEQVELLSYDDEHHRVAFLALSKYAARPTDETVGFYHSAFAYRSLGELLGNYLRLRDAGILPQRCINHGGTTSMYYADPDGNQVELQVDAFSTSADVNRFLQSKEFASNPIGIEFDPNELIARYEAGAPERELLLRSDLNPAEFSQVGA